MHDVQEESALLEPLKKREKYPSDSNKTKLITEKKRREIMDDKPSFRG